MKALITALNGDILRRRRRTVRLRHNGDLRAVAALPVSVDRPYFYQIRLIIYKLFFVKSVYCQRIF